VDPRIGLDSLVEKKISYPSWKSKHDDSSVVNCTGRAVSALVIICYKELNGKSCFCCVDERSVRFDVI